MSEMVANKGIIKEIYPEVEGVRGKLEALAKDLNVKLSEIVNESALEEYNEALFNSGAWNKYTFIKERLFDTSNCPDIYDYESEHEDTLKKVGDHEYKLDFYYYNGGTNMEEIFEELVDKADEEYGTSSEEELDKIMEDLITGHNFDYARKALLEWKNK